MDTFILRIQRESGGVCGIGLSTEVSIDGANKRNFKAGDIQEYELPRKMTTIRLYNSVPVGKDMEASFMVNPDNHKIVVVTFCYKMNPKYLLPFGAFRHPQFLFDHQIHFNDMGAKPSYVATPPQGQPATPPTQPTQPAAQPTPQPAQPTQATAQPAAQSNITEPKDFKFCTECGTKNKREAKFCIGCGNPFQM